MNKTDALILCDKPKFCSANLVWGTKQNQVNILVATSNLEDADGATLAGLTLQLEVKKAILVNRYHYELGLFKLVQSVRTRAYQLNVTPQDFKSHIGAEGIIYGPHEHHGDVATAFTSCILDEDFSKAFQVYCLRTNLTFTGKLNSPI